MRTEPVRREEVRIDGYAIATLPADACRRCPHLYWWETYYEAIPELFAPLVEELRQAQQAALAGLDPAVAARWAAINAGLRDLGIGRMSPSRAPRMPDPMGRFPRHCRHCGRAFFNGRRIHGRCCSDACVAARTRRLKIARVAKLRQRARQGRTCEHCGAPIAAARSTRRFCSDICRVRAHRKLT
jgi:hypothetical protein